MANKVLVIGEMRDGEFRNVSFEAIAAAKQVAPDGEVVGALLGSGVEAEAGKLFQFGADRVVVVDDEKLKEYTPEGYTQAAKALVDQEEPDAIIMGHTSIGRDLSAKLAARMEAGLISDAVSLEMDGDDAVFTRPIYSGKAFEKVKVKDGVTFATIRPNNIPALDEDSSKSGSVEKVDVAITDLKTIIKEVVKNTASGVDLSEASVIVAGGRGVKSEENFNQLYELADLLGGAVGASRGACDAEYCDYALQIGQTGKVVTPDLYIAVGLSGAIQHVAGMSNSKVIVAINKDPEAEIFQIADYGIVGDLFEVMPQLIEEFKKVVV
ncbi:electron transfer flavoprotein subunit alpha/FixB family protein [Salisediminibacterium selenitireducens]|uniref:Electron transfer flavoprotein alpha/beta-subunit n=1 Tax=Bacillus selenitireducens (strain ATCC 700615 / DSM 15326 / MLS10) TaxID=439292 RepID=D6XSX2_BACIE|nr:electron transfer flavoprotein subunit alpha/FixB family protein [Salisediminibacterium selenitireducens]ADH98908.1 Electron transfer flavoprotein alpha/beta-subunit [[Bacillus] selenitireducens MLS10]